MVAALLRHQLVKYVVVGGIGYLANLVAFWSSIEVFGINEYLSLGPAFIANTGSNFILNKLWTFEASGRSAADEFWRFMVVAFACLGVNTLLFHFYFGILGIDDLVAQGLAVITGLPVGFFGSRMWAFAPAPVAPVHVEELDEA